MNRSVVALFLLVLSVPAAFATALAPNQAVILVNGAPLYEENNKVLKALDYLTLGDVVTLMNRTGSFKESGKDRDFTRIKAGSGKEGWVRSQFLAGKASIAFVKVDKATIYSEPREVKITSRYISGMTLVAVLQDGSTGSFAKVQGYDAAQGVIFTDSTFVSTDDLTSADADVQAGILYDVAMATKDPGVKKNLLKIAGSKYSSSVFLPRIQTAQGITPTTDAPTDNSDQAPVDNGG